jgi:hypothetical protein
MVVNQTPPFSRLLVLKYVSNALDLDVASWIDTTLPEFSLATQQPTRISVTSISLLVSSKRVTMPSLRRFGIFNQQDPQQQNFCMTLAWNPNPTLSLSMDLSIQPLQVPLNIFLSLGSLSRHQLLNLSGRILCQASWLPYHFASQRHRFKSQLTGHNKDDK